MKVGIFLVSAQPPFLTQREVLANSLDYAELAEELGFTNIWILEHHFTPLSICPSSIVMAAHVLGRTRRMRVGTAVSIVTLEHPIRLAEQVALIDQLSEGRFDLGIGRGAGNKDFPVFGVDASNNRRTMEEWVEIMRAAWTQERVEWSSDLITFPKVPVYPQPWTSPHPPLYVACDSPTSVEYAARNGFPMLLSYWIQRETLAGNVELYREVAEAHGQDPDPSRHVVSMIVHLEDTREAAQAAVYDNMLWWREAGSHAYFTYEELKSLTSYEHAFRRWEEGLLAAQTGTTTTIDDLGVQRLLDCNPVDTPEAVVARIQELRDEVGLEHFVCGFEASGNRDRIVDTMRRFAAEVMPELDLEPVAPAAPGARP
jgi:alkanal monooxygenase alpha chain